MLFTYKNCQYQCLAGILLFKPAVHAVFSQGFHAAAEAVEQYVLINDPAQPSLYDAVVTVKDTAKITKDGAVVGGNKIKMGLPITIEGENYKFNGIISDVRVTTDAEVEDSGENSEVG